MTHRLKPVAGQTLVIATIRDAMKMACSKSAQVFLHNPPVSVDNVSTEGLVPFMHVEGDIISKKFDFMMGDLETEPFKIAKVRNFSITVRLGEKDKFTDFPRGQIETVFRQRTIFVAGREELGDLVRGQQLLRCHRSQCGYCFHLHLRLRHRRAVL